MKLKRLAAFSASFLLSLSSLLVFAPTVHAAVDLCLWTGATNNNFNNATNWNCVTDGADVPGTGDSIEFNNTSLSNDVTLTNDITGGSFANISFQGSGNDSFTLGGNAITLTGGITNTSNAIHTVGLDMTISGSQNITTTSGNLIIEGDLSGSGALSKTGSYALSLNGNNGTYSGAITISAGHMYVGHVNGLGTTGAGTTVADGAQLILDLIDINQTTFTVAEPLTLAGDNDGLIWSDYALGVIGCGSPCISNADVTLSGAITLTANTQLATHSKVTLTGAITGSFTLAMAKTYSGQFVVNSSANGSSTPNGTLRAPTYTTTYSDSQPANPVTVNYNETVVVTGTRQAVFIDNGGILKGTGTVGSVQVTSGGKLAPGLSPGCMNTGDLSFVSGSAYDFELGGATECTGYDRINVTGTVTLGNGTLNTLLVNDFKPAAGNAFTIISNDAADAVSGTFNNLAEGATFTVSGYVFRISYVGGDGNDVVLTVQTVPATPDTGFKLVLSHPLISMTATIFATAALLLIARKYNKNAAKK